MKVMTCLAVRSLLQEAHDGSGPVPSSVSAHLDDCSACRRFASFLESLGGDLRDALDREAAVDPDIPDLKKLALLGRKRVRTRRLIGAVSGLAAALLIGIGGLLAVNRARENDVRQYVSEETGLFVDELFSEPVLAGFDLVSFGDLSPD